MVYVPGWQRRLALSYFKKEASFNAGVTINSTNACEVISFDSDPPVWDDEIVNDADEINGGEQATMQEIFRQKVTLPLSFPRMRPNDLAGLGALVLGGITTVQDGSETAYRHKLTPVAFGTNIPSLAMISKDGAQYVYRGLIGKSLTIKGAQDGFLGLECELIGSGYRASDATSFPNKIVESWLKSSQTKIWLESGGTISIDSTPTQGLENISSGTPTDLSLRIQNFTFKWDNNPFLNWGYGSASLQEAIQGAVRTPSFSFTLLYTNENEIDLYTNQTTVAMEIDCNTASLIDPQGAYNYGFDLILRGMKLKKVGKAGKKKDWLTQEVEAQFLDDGVNPMVQLYVYNAQAAYLAA